MRRFLGRLLLLLSSLSLLVAVGILFIDMRWGAFLGLSETYRRLADLDDERPVIVGAMYELANPNRDGGDIVISFDSLIVDFSKMDPGCLTALYASEATSGGAMMSSVPTSEPVVLNEFKELCGLSNLYTLDLTRSNRIELFESGQEYGVVMKHDFLKLHAANSELTSAGDLASYPFDLQSVNIAVWLEVQTPSGEKRTIAPGVIILDRLADWSAYRSSRHDSYFDYPETPTGYITVENIDLHRPLSLRLISVILLILMAVFILLLPFVADIGNALQVAVAVVLGLWGLRAALVPQSIGTTTMIDWGFRALFVLLAWAAVMRFIILPLLKRR